ncbi:hypothetical protein ACGFX4_09480 [Kitasatospora sp. NPDC048365]|uniref:hypothetical protein n=1 Tax=Kitasatospora sp. NPDC048365 TaxID=3364050 RepID=UPI003720CF2F
MTATPEDMPAPITADTRLIELRDFAAEALDCWKNGDQQGAHQAATEATGAASAAAAALNVLLELDREIAAEQQTRDGGDAADWLG